MKYYLVLCVFLMLIGFGIQGVSGDTGQITEVVSLSGDGILIANGEDQATITVNVVDTASGDPMPNLPITFTLNDPTLGSLIITDTTTDGNGNADTVFTAGTKFGQAIVTVEIDYPDTEPQQMVIKLTGYPDTVNISGSVDWLVAGQTATSSLITVQAFNQSNPIPNLQVEFSVLNPSMGTVTVSNGITDSDGKATTSFKPSTISGIAYVQAVVKFTDEYITYTEPRIHYQLVDHAAPDASSIWYDAPSEMLVGDTTTITVAYFDQYGNPIDNRKSPEYLNFSVNSPSTPSPNPPEEIPAGFWNGYDYVQSVTVELDENGYATVEMKADTRPGLNRITVDPQFPGLNKIISIDGIAESVPVVIEYEISSPYIPADGQSVFTILYTLKDQFNNPVSERSFWMNTSIGDPPTLLTTNSSGMVKTTYGPKIRTDIIYITMTAYDAKPDGTYATNSTTVEITSLEPVQMSLTANPQFVPSWDVPGETAASIKAVVMDRYGNPVKNETVVFQIIPGTWEYEYETGLGPQWRDYGDSTVIMTTTPHDNPVDSYASAEFRPGYFPGEGDPQEHDSCIITAQWTGYPTQTVTINWTNVPFLSISTDVSPAVVAWNDTVTVNIKVLGNGYALRPKPIDAVLILDVSGSMSGTDISPSRMQAAKNAAKNFVGNMDVSTGRDRIALVSFSSDVTVNQGLTDDRILINSSIDSLNAFGATNLRKAYYEGIKHLKDNGRDSALKAVILMTDGDWNLHGNPLAEGVGFPDTDSYKTVRYQEYETYYGIPRSSYPWLGSGSSFYQASIRNSRYGDSYSVNGYEWYSSLPDPKGTITSTQRWWYRYHPTNSWKQGYVCMDGQNTNQNMSIYAISGDEKRQVKIYTIGFAQDLNDNVEADLSTLSEATDGWYQWAGNEEQLDNLYTNIVGELKEEAGIGVQMDLPFEDITVATNTSSWTVDGKEVFDYIPYTDEWKYWFNTTPVTTIYRYPDRDDTPNWLAGEILFDIGTIKLNQAWETTFSLEMKDNPYNVGRITIFDRDATIQFSDGKDWFTLSLPNTYITCIGDQSQTQIATEEAGYDITSITNESTMITVTFDRLFLVNGTPQDEWYRTWYENYFIDIPGYRSKTKIGSRVIPPTVPKTGTYTFDLGPYLPPGQSSVDFNFYVEGTDKTIDAVNRKRSNLRMDPGKIYILLK